MDMIVINADDELTHIKLRGRVDLDTIGDLDCEFTRQTVTRRKDAVVDMSDVDYMASIGLRMLITAAKALDKFGAKMVLLNPHPDVEDVLRTAGFDKVMPIEHDLESAREALRGLA
ncbi:MAG TPA: STAS domain-containing protein [Thermodesulfobacteriota bacterium]|nr:STAS domain-containing protein [Thermodesulfobacteriota bacterium]